MHIYISAAISQLSNDQPELYDELVESYQAYSDCVDWGLDQSLRVEGLLLLSMSPSIALSQWCASLLEKIFLSEWQKYFNEEVGGRSQFKRLMSEAKKYSASILVDKFYVSNILLCVFQNSLRNQLLYKDYLVSLLIIRSLLAKDGYSTKKSGTLDILTVETVLSNLEYSSEEYSQEIFTLGINLLNHIAWDYSLISVSKEAIANSYEFLSFQATHSKISKAYDACTILPELLEVEIAQNISNDLGENHQIISRYTAVFLKAIFKENAVNQEFIINLLGVLTEKESFYTSASIEDFLEQVLLASSEYHDTEALRQLLKIILQLVWNQTPFDERCGEYHEAKSLLALISSNKTSVAKQTVFLMAKAEYYTSRDSWYYIDGIIWTNLLNVYFSFSSKSAEINSIKSILLNMVHYFSEQKTFFTQKLNSLFLQSSYRLNKQLFLAFIDQIIFTQKNHVISVEQIKLINTFLSDSETLEINIQAIGLLLKITEKNYESCFCISKFVDYSRLFTVLFQIGFKPEVEVYKTIQRLLFNILTVSSDLDELQTKIEPYITVEVFNAFIGQLSLSLHDNVLFSEDQMLFFLFSFIEEIEVTDEIKFLAATILTHLAKFSVYQLKIAEHEFYIKLLLAQFQENQKSHTESCFKILAQVLTNAEILREEVIRKLLQSSLSFNTSRRLNLSWKEIFQQISWLLRNQASQCLNVQEFLFLSELNGVLDNKIDAGVFVDADLSDALCALDLILLYIEIHKNNLELDVSLVENMTQILHHNFTFLCEKSSKIIGSAIIANASYKEHFIQKGAFKQLLILFQELPRKEFHYAIAQLTNLQNSDDYIQQEEIGKGGFGHVALYEHKITKKRFAAKALHSILASHHEEIENFAQEIDVLRKVNGHPHIINFEGVMFKSSVCLLLVMELGYTSLEKLLYHSDVNLHKEAKRQYCLGIALAVEYLHDLNLLHRDIKPSNVLLTSDGVVKLADFGFAISSSQMSGIAGTTNYLAPEVLCDGKPNSVKTDLWALGITFLEIFEQKKPFELTPGFALAVSSCVRKYFDKNFEPRTAMKPKEIKAYINQLRINNQMAFIQSPQSFEQRLVQHCTYFQPLHRASAKEVVERIKYPEKNAAKHSCYASGDCANADDGAWVVVKPSGAGSCVIS